MLPYNTALKSRSRKLRREMTDAERALWLHLRRKQLLGIQFYRQKPLGNFIVDFYAPRAKVVIEVDGSQHGESSAVEADAVRDEYLSGLGLAVLRFDNLQVLRETTAVLEAIRLKLAAVGSHE